LLATRFHRTGKLNRASEEEDLLGERGLAGVRMRDDRERTTAGDFVL